MIVVECFARALIVVSLVACSVTVHARAFEVRLLEGNEQAGVWGTDEFSVAVNSQGLLRHVKVNGREIIWQAAALYTFPIPLEESKGVRTVQGEGHGERGLTVEPSRMQTRDERGRRVFEFDHLVASKKVLGGRPLCKVGQQVTILPTGEINVAYECEWLETLRWQTFQLLLMFDKGNCESRKFLAAAPDVLRVGKLDPGPRSGDVRQIRGVPFEQLTIRPEVGPVHFVWDEPSDCSFHWGTDVQLRIAPQSLPRRTPILKGRKARISYRILLPVLQE